MLYHKREQKTEKKHLNYLRKLIVITVVVVLCYSFTAYAWFQASFVSTGNTIAAGTYQVSITITEPDSTGSIFFQGSAEKDSLATVTLNANTSYTVTLTNATVTTGYCVISAGTQQWTTAQISPDGLTFTLVPDATGDYTFEAHWGTPAQVDIQLNAIIGTPTDPGDTTNPSDDSDGQSVGDAGSQPGDQTSGNTDNGQPDTSKPTDGTTDIGTGTDTDAGTSSDDTDAADSSTGDSATTDTDGTTSSAADHTQQQAQIGNSSSAASSAGE